MPRQLSHRKGRKSSCRQKLIWQWAPVTLHVSLFAPTEASDSSIKSTYRWPRHHRRTFCCNCYLGPAEAWRIWKPTPSYNGVSGIYRETKEMACRRGPRCLIAVGFLPECSVNNVVFTPAVACYSWLLGDRQLMTDRRMPRLMFRFVSILLLLSLLSLTSIATYFHVATYRRVTSRYMSIKL